MEKANLLDNIPRELPAELSQTLLSSGRLRIERIISRGHESGPDFWYDQEQPEWVLLLRGAARLQFPEGTLDLGCGDYVHIPAHQKHRIAWTAPEQETIWLAIFY
ncbi:MAG: cupin domain-containing protein [Rhodoferax sp.]|uniref:cupin domain-containing protein n=1 Tax=Rhodoferax sp. TaxID=50421 RepID=UPI002612E2C0|nr:cupin domain-containing protein [Rhodoferax sp.]MDD5335173.1 cupin domain-containing protein [Rhodoferax sp.]